MAREHVFSAAAASPSLLGLHWRPKNQKSVTHVSVVARQTLSLQSSSQARLCGDDSNFCVQHAFSYEQHETKLSSMKHVPC